MSSEKFQSFGGLCASTSAAFLLAQSPAFVSCGLNRQTVHVHGKRPEVAAGPGSAGEGDVKTHEESCFTSEFIQICLFLRMVFVCTWKPAGSVPGRGSFATEVCFSVAEVSLFLEGGHRDELIPGAPPPGASPQSEPTERQT